MIHELPDTVKKKETEAQAYAAVWDLMANWKRICPWLLFLRPGHIDGK